MVRGDIPCQVVLWTSNVEFTWNAKFADITTVDSNAVWITVCMYVVWAAGARRGSTWSLRQTTAGDGGGQTTWWRRTHWASAAAAAAVCWLTHHREVLRRQNQQHWRTWIQCRLQVQSSEDHRTTGRQDVIYINATPQNICSSTYIDTVSLFVKILHKNPVILAEIP